MRLPPGTALWLPVLLTAGVLSWHMACERSGAAAVKPDASAARAGIPERYKWDLAPLFADDAAWEAALPVAGADVARLGGFAGKLADPAELARCLDLYFATRIATNRLTLYAALRFDSHRKAAELQAMRDRSLAALDRLMAAGSFIRDEVNGLDDAAMTAAYAAEPGLVPYRPYLDELRRRRGRLLPSASEKLLSLAGDNLWAEIDLNEIPSDHEKAFLALISELPLPEIRDEQGKQVQLTLANYGRYRGSKDRRVRRDTVEGLFGALGRFEHTFASLLSGQVRFSVFLARARGYDHALDAYLDMDDIAPAVYRNLVATIRGNVAPLHDYIALRKELAGVEELHLYDLYPPLTEAVDVDVPFEEARRLLPKALAPLGPAYVTVLERGLDPANRWIDVYPHQDKEGGAGVSSLFGVHPYVKLNYFDGLEDLSTLAHEMGHALHSHLSNDHQPYVSADYASFIAETASTLNEKLLSDYLIANAKTDAEKAYLLGKLAETIRTTIYRQALFAEFELAAHEAVEAGEPLTPDMLNGTYARLIREYYGPALTLGDEDGVEWAYVPHFYYKFYLYTYATGLSAGIALAERVRTGGPEALEAYLGMLKSGSSKPPLELMAAAGVDLTKPAPIEAAARLLDRTVKELRRLLKKG